MDPGLSGSNRLASASDFGPAGAGLTRRTVRRHYAAKTDSFSKRGFDPHGNSSVPIRARMSGPNARNASIADPALTRSISYQSAQFKNRIGP